MYKVDFVADSITGQMPDIDVITRIVEGEKNLYAILVKRYNQRLYRVAISIINDDTEVDDAMQAAYIKAFENLGKFSFKSDFSTWLTRILINECLQVRKKRKYNTGISNHSIANEIHQQPISETSTPIAQLMNTELKTILERAILELPEKYRTVFVMREIEDMSIAETKACLQISGINVKVRLNRAKALLRKSLNNSYVKDELFHFHLTRCNGIVTKVLQTIGA